MAGSTESTAFSVMDKSCRRWKQLLGAAAAGGHSLSMAEHVVHLVRFAIVPLYQEAEIHTVTKRHMSKAHVHDSSYVMPISAS